MAKLIVPFVPADPQYCPAGTKFVQTDKPYYREYRTLEGHLINSENDAVAGQEFIHYYGSGKIGVFRSMDEIFTAKLTVTRHAYGSWAALEDSEKVYRYLMTTSELTHMIHAKTLVNGTVEGVFGFVSKGGSISLKNIA